MIRIAPKFALALVAAAGVSATAVAADKTAQAPANADKTQVAPSRDDLQPANPSLRRMDDNVQRQHDNDRDGNTSAPNTRTGAGMAGSAQGDSTRDWNAIDTNNDNLIQPAEMEVALKAVGPQAKPAK